MSYLAKQKGSDGSTLQMAGIYTISKTIEEPKERELPVIEISGQECFLFGQLKTGSEIIM